MSPNGVNIWMSPDGVNISLNLDMLLSAVIASFSSLYAEVLDSDLN